MDKTEKALEGETKRWLRKLKEEVGKKDKKAALSRAAVDRAMGPSIRNMQAYIQDCSHFLGKGDAIRAFEAIIYAWGIWSVARRCIPAGHKAADADDL